MRTLSKLHRLSETIEDLNICKFIEMQVYERRAKPITEQFALLINEALENVTETDSTLLAEKLVRLKKAGFYDCYPVQVVNDFNTRAKKTIAKLFPADFTDNEFIRHTIIDLLILKCEYYQTDRYFEMDLHAKIEELQAILNQETKGQGSVIELYQSFEAICFSMAHADGAMTVREIKQLSVYEFYTHKKLLTEKMKRNGRGSNYTV